MSDDRELFEKFGKSNKLKDFIEFIKDEETEWFLRKITLVTDDGFEWTLDCTKNQIQKAIKAKSRKKKS